MGLCVPELLVFFPANMNGVLGLGHEKEAC